MEFLALVASLAIALVLFLPPYAAVQAVPPFVRHIGWVAVVALLILLGEPLRSIPRPYVYYVVPAIYVISWAIILGALVRTLVPERQVGAGYWKGSMTVGFFLSFIVSLMSQFMVDGL